jgi:hypothetical protein
MVLLKPSIQKKDALHVLTAENSDYLVTTDEKFNRSGVKEVNIVALITDKRSP